MRFAIAALFAVHGVAHLVGFVVPWKLANLEEMPYKTTLLGGKVDVGDRGIRVVGVLWLLMALAFFASGAAVVFLVSWWAILSAVAAVASTVLCILGWPDSKYGVVVNIVILAFLIVGGQLGWLPMAGD